MVEPWCSVVLVGMAVGRRGTACCYQPMGRRSRFEPCMPGRLDVGRLACGLFIVWSLCCSSLIGSRLCSPRRCSRTWFSLSSRLVLRVAAACLSGAVYVPRRWSARCVVLVGRRLFAGGQPVWVAWWPVWARPAVFGRCIFSSARLFPGGDVVSRCARFRDVRACGCCVVGIPMAGTSSSAPPNGRLVSLMDTLGCGGRVGPVPVVPVAWGRYGTVWRCAAPSWRGVSSGEKSFEIRYDTPFSCPGGIFTRTILHLVLRSVLPPSFPLRLCRSYVHPRRRQCPFGPPRRILVLPMGASGCCPGSVVRCLCSCSPACRVPYRAVSCGFGGWRVGAAVRCAGVRVAWFVLWRLGVPSGASGRARRNTLVFAGMSRRARGSCVASSWPLACPW